MNAVTGIVSENKKAGPHKETCLFRKYTVIEFYF